MYSTIAGDDPIILEETKQEQHSQHHHHVTSFSSSGDSILSEKVSRALQVRTDTPAMKAALDALALLSTTTNSVVRATTANDSSIHNNNNNSTMWIDSRSVRVVMEQDALQQALLLQEQLQQLVNQVVDLRLGVTEIATIAAKVQDAIHTNVVVSSNNNVNTMYQPKHHQQQQQQALLSDRDDLLLDHSERSDASVKDNQMTLHAITNNTLADPSSSSNSLEQEQKLAAMLYDSFRHRQVSRQRLEAVMTFLEKFDLSEQDARLLDHYAFEDVVMISGSGGGGGSRMDHNNVPVNGMAFLTALHRVRNIRQALGQSFGTTTSSMETTSSSSSSSSSFGATSALRMMESLAQKQEKAYERLYHWLQKFLHLHTTYAVGGSGGNPLSSSNTSDYQYDGFLQGNDHDDDVLDEALIQNVFVKRALHTLQHVPAFYAHTLELIATFRRGRETRKFLLALTSGYSGMPPLELKAHDAVQYVGDMLAFMFQQTNMEADVAKNVLLTPYRDRSAATNANGDEEGGPDEERNEHADDEDAAKETNSSDYASSASTVPNMEDRAMTAAEMVSQAMGGVARPLKSRILQVIANLARRGEDEDDDEDAGDDDRHRHHRSSGASRSRGIEDDLDEEGSAARRKTCQLYEICGLLSFYHSALNKTIQKLQPTAPVTLEGNEAALVEDESTPNPLVAAILECWVAATNGYVASLRVYGAMLEQLAVLTGESEASLAHAMMVQLAQVRVASPGFASDMELPNAQEALTSTGSSQNAAKALSLEWILETLIDSSLPLCKTLDDALLLKQGLSAAKKAGMSGEVASLMEDRIQEQESKLIEGLVEIETAHVLEMCGLGSVATSWKRFCESNNADEIGNEPASVTAVMAGHPGLSQNQLEAAMKEFYASLYSPPLPSLERTVENVALRKLARQKIATNVAEFYADVYNHASLAGSGYTDLSFLGHTPEQVRTLFSA